MKNEVIDKRHDQAPDRRTVHEIGVLLGSFNTQNRISWWIVNREWTELRARGGACDDLFGLGPLDGPDTIYGRFPASDRGELAELAQNQRVLLRCRVKNSGNNWRLLTLTAHALSEDSVVYFAVDVTSESMDDIDYELAAKVLRGNTGITSQIREIYPQSRFEATEEATRLVRSLNSSREQISELTSSLTVTREDLLAAQTSIKHLEAALDVERQARRQATQALKQYEETLARIVHDMRSPLNTIQGFGELLLNSEERPEQRLWLSHTRRSGEHLMETAELLLQLVASSSGRSEVTASHLLARPIVDEVVSVVQQQARERDIDLVVSVNLDQKVTANRLLFSRVLSNLVSNALEHSPVGGVVRIECDDAGQFVTFMVTDSGSGIATEAENQLFQPFSQGQHGTLRASGAGLGLAICREHVAAMGGAIGVFNQPSGGATFWFDLPGAVAETEGPLVLVGTTDVATAELIRAAHQDTVITRTLRSRHALVHAACTLNPAVICLADDLVEEADFSDLVATVRVEVGESPAIVVFSSNPMYDQIPGITRRISFPATIGEIALATSVAVQEAEP